MIISSPATVDPASVVLGLTANSFTYGDGSGNLASTANPTNGQLLIGSTGAAPGRATLTGTASQITVTNAAASITLATPQSIATGSSVQFASLGLGAAVTSAEILSLTGSGTIASAAGAVWNADHTLASTATITGSTNITTTAGFNLVQIERPTLSAASALTVTNAATFTIINSPAASGAGPATITNALSLWVQAGTSLFGGVVAGSTAASGTFTVRATTNSTTGNILLNDLGGSVLLGYTTISANSEMLGVRRTFDGATRIYASNQNATANAIIQFTAENDGGNACSTGITSSGWTTSSGLNANEAFILSGRPVVVATAAIQPIRFVVNTVEVARFTSTTNTLQFNNTGLVQGGTAGATSLTLSSTSNGTKGNVQITDGSTFSINTGLFNITSIGQSSGTTAVAAITSGINTGGAIPYFTITGAASTSQTASTEINFINFNLGQTVTWATGALTTERAWFLQAPTLAFNGASTVTNSITAAINAAPTAGSNATLTNSFALQVGGSVTIGATAAGMIYGAIDVPAHTVTVTGTTQVTSVGFSGIRIAQVTITDASVVTVNNAASLYISAAPVAAGSVTLTNAYSLWIDAGAARFDGNLDFSVSDSTNIVLGTTTGTKIGTATSQKLGFFNATPVVQEAGTNDVLASLVTLGLRAASSNPPLNLGTGAITAGAATLAATTVTTLGTAGLVTLADGNNIAVGSTTGTKIGTATTQKVGFFNAAPVVQQTDGATLTNNVTAGGTTDTIANYTDLVTYSNDAAAIRNDIYQLSRKVKIIVDALRSYGLLS